MVYIYSNLLKQKTKELIAHGRAVMSVTKYEPANLLQALNLQQAHHAVITTFFCRHTQGRGGRRQKFGMRVQDVAFQLFMRDYGKF